MAFGPFLTGAGNAGFPVIRIAGRHAIQAADAKRNIGRAGASHPFIPYAAFAPYGGRLRPYIARANGATLNHWDAVDMTNFVATSARSSRP